MREKKLFQNEIESEKNFKENIFSKLRAMEKERDTLDEQNEQSREKLESVKKLHNEKSTKLDEKEAELVELKGEMEKLKERMSTEGL